MPSESHALLQVPRLLFSKLSSPMWLQRLLNVWFPLWQLVFQPAIGTLMLGAVSHALSRPLQEVNVMGGGRGS